MSSQSDPEFKKTTCMLYDLINKQRNRIMISTGKHEWYVHFSL